jgi:hypothetical protein
LSFESLSGLFIFVGKAWRLSYKGAPEGQIDSNIRLDWKGFSGENAFAYLSGASMTEEKVL